MLVISLGSCCGENCSPPCFVETDEDERALGGYLGAVEQAQSMDRQAVRNIAAAQFHNERIIDQVIAAAAPCGVLLRCQ
jgi:hypothetical protein